MGAPSLRRDFRGFLNDLGRSAIGALLHLAGLAAVLRHRARLRLHPYRERRLPRRLGITSATPVTPALPAVDDRSGTPVALTSGTAGEPKRIPYSPERVRATRAVFVDGMLRLIAERRIRRPSLYVFGALEPDRSLSWLLVRERRAPPWFVLLQAPYRAQSDPAFLDLKDRYGATALRLLVLTLSNPGILYATNPSTLSGFLEELEADWKAARRLVRDVVRDGKGVSPFARRILGRLASRGSAARLRRVSESSSPLPAALWNPAFTTYVCWTGGSVRPFLERLDRRLPLPRYRREPMFSMSTETIETIPDYRRGDTAFLPAAPGVLHEFRESSAAGPLASLSGARDLNPDTTYEMVVSHRFGLRRYATGDLFRVERFIAGLPDLRFVGRRGLGWSFTGEKITAEQVGCALEVLDTEHPGLREEFWLAIFPRDPGGAELPCYQLAVVRRENGSGALPPGLAERLDELLAGQNLEYRAKRASRRLGAVRSATLEPAEFVRRASGGGLADPDSQFKFQPFYPRLWEEG